ncbi:MAG: hypothetical protein LUG27_11570 [Clostridiales bacterium]|nr:hypothetical protein [Clostridiales bacterium]
MNYEMTGDMYIPLGQSEKDVDRFIQYLLDISEEFSVNYSLKQENN